MDAIFFDLNLLREILSHLRQRDAIRSRRTCQSFRQACDSLPQGSFRPRVFLACSRSGKMLDIDPLAECMVTATGRWPQQTKGRQQRLGCGPKDKEPHWITGICINPGDRGVYALQYRVRGVVRFSGNSAQYKRIVIKHPKMEVRPFS